MVLKEGKSEARSVLIRSILTRSVLKRGNLFFIVPLGMIATLAWSLSSSQPFQHAAQLNIGMVVMLIGVFSTVALMLLAEEKAILRASATLLIAVLMFFTMISAGTRYDTQVESLVKEAYSSQFNVSQDSLSVRAWSKDSAKMSGFADQCEQKNVSCYSVDVPGKNKHETVTRYVLAHTSPDKVKSLEVLAERTVKIEVKKF